MSSMLEASRRKSSSSTIVSANNSTSAGGFASAAILMRPTKNGASHAITFRSLRTSVPTCGRCTLTTTDSPVRSIAACTWAIEAAAIGAVSNDANTSSSRAPRSSSTTRRTSSNDSAGTWSRQRLNSSTSSAGKRPSPLEMICASLMYVEPSRSMAWRMRSDKSARDASGDSYLLRRRFHHHGPSATPRRKTTTTSRATGGTRGADINDGSSSRACMRMPSTRPRQRTASLRNTHGAAPLNAPHSRSGGVAAGVTAFSTLAVCRCERRRRRAQRVSRL